MGTKSYHLYKIGAMHNMDLMLYETVAHNLTAYELNDFIIVGIARSHVLNKRCSIFSNWSSHCQCRPGRGREALGSLHRVPGGQHTGSRPAHQQTGILPNRQRTDHCQ